MSAIAGTAFGATANGPAKIVKVLQYGELLLDDGSLWVTKFKSMQLNLVDAAGSGSERLGLTAEGKLIRWNAYDKPETIAEGVKQISGSYWLQKDEAVWTWDERGAGKKKVDMLPNAVLIASESDGAVALDSSGQILSYRPSYSQPALIGTVPDTSSVLKIVQKGNQAAVLFKDGKVVLYDTYHFDYNDPKLRLIPETLAQDGADLSFGQETLLVVKKDGTLWQNGTGTFDNRFKLTRVDGVDQLKRVTATGTGSDFYAQQSDGGWVAFKNGKLSKLEVPSIAGLSLKASNNKPYVGETIKVTVELVSGSGDKTSADWNQLQLSTDKPHLIQLSKSGEIRSTGVGEATLKVDGYGKTEQLKIVSSLKNRLEGGKVVKGLTYLPLESVMKALGGTVDYVSSSKTYNVQVGEVRLAISKGNKSANVNGKAVAMDGAPIDENGKTLISADILRKALGAGLKWDAANKRMTVSIGAGQLTVNAGDKPKSMSEAAATGSMSGWKILKGHPYEKSVAIYFTYKNGILKTHVVDIRPVNLNKKVTWTDDSGKKRVNTVKEIYTLFSKLSGQYTSDWFSKKFGSLYADWLLSSAVPAEQYVEQYLIESGQMEAPGSNVTLTPDFVLP